MEILVALVVIGVLGYWFWTTSRKEPIKNAEPEVLYKVETPTAEDFADIAITQRPAQPPAPVAQQEEKPAKAPAKPRAKKPAAIKAKPKAEAKTEAKPKAAKKPRNLKVAK